MGGKIAGLDRQNPAPLISIVRPLSEYELRAEEKTGDDGRGRKTPEV